MLLTITALLLSRCSSRTVSNNKDLDDNMLDIRMYHDNLGLYLRKQDADYAGWLLEGMDSTLKVIASKFTSHRKLSEPFANAYKNKLAPSIHHLRTALQQQDFAAAKQAYQRLTQKCNNCHIDNNVEKEVQDWSH